MFIPDLSAYPGFAKIMPTRSIGWLSGQNYPRGPVPEGFLDKLSRVEKDIVLVRVLATGGFHPCEYCRPDGSEHKSSCQFFSTNGFVWPEMLTHYVRDHGYKPPDEFVNWVMEQ